MTDEIKKRIAEALEFKLGRYAKKEDGYYHDEIYADYRDEMDDKTAIEIAEREDPYQTFNEKMLEWYQEAEFERFDEIKKDVITFLAGQDGELPDGLTEDMLDDYLRDIVCIDYPEDHYLDQEVCVNIMVDTGDGNYDYVLNCVYPHYNGRYEDTIDDKASIVWLAKQQGYKKSELRDALREGDVGDPKGFLESMRQEVINHPTHMACLTFLVRMTLRDLIELNEIIKLQERDGHKYDATKRPYCGYIIIDKKAETGLYNPWDGGGSVLEIQLEKDVRLPIRFIRSALPDGADGYSISNVYGVDGSLWRRDTVKKIHKPCKVMEVKA